MTLQRFYKLAAVATLISMANAAAADDHRIDIHDYRITIDYSLSQLWVEARFAYPVKTVAARSRDAGKYLIDVRSCDSDQGIRIRNRRMLLPEGGIRCINYAVDMQRAARYDRAYRHLSKENIIVSPSLWLWRPELTETSEIEATFRLPHDARVSVPWKSLSPGGSRYRIGPSPESSHAAALFGKFDYDEYRVAGALLRVSVARTNQNADVEALQSWVHATATDVSLAYGRFPNPSPQVIVIPIPKGVGNGAVPYGRVIRDGGESVQLFVNTERPIDEYFADWTATHEFSHLMLPYLRQRDRWISEGFAQYYQNVLLGRAGQYSELQAWQNIYDGLERGRKSRPELSPNDAAEGKARNGTMKVYWSGAAIALMADVELRRRSDGDQSLDTVLERLQACCLPANRVWSGPELFTTLDKLIDEPLFMPLYRRYADTAGFPDTSSQFAQLGFSISNDRLKIRRNAELADIRTAITQRDEATASWRQRLASGW